MDVTLEGVQEKTTDQTQHPPSTPEAPETGHGENVRGPIFFGLLLLVVSFLGFGVWSIFVPLDSAVLAPGVAVVESERKVVQHLEGGIVKQILVKDGDYVRKDDLLVELDNTQAGALVEIIKGQLYASRALEARLLAERDGVDTVTYPLELHGDDSEATREIIRGQNLLFEARRHSVEGQISILNQQISQSREQIAGLQSEQNSREEQIALYRKQLEGMEKLLSKGHLPEYVVIERKRALAQLQGEEGKFKSDVARVRQDIAESELKIDQIRKAQREEIVQQLRDVQDKIASLQERMVAARDVLERTRIRAPYSGIVLGLSAHTEGGVIGRGVDILQIVPQDEKLVFEVRVEPTDIDDVVVGQPADLRLTAFSFRNSYLLTGEVTHVSADRLTDPRTEQPYFAVTISVPNTELVRLEDARIVPGMPVEAHIKTGSHTLLTYMIEPIRDAMWRAFREKY